MLVFVLALSCTYERKHVTYVFLNLANFTLEDVLELSANNKISFFFIFLLLLLLRIMAKLFFFNFYFMHMCIQCLGHFSPLPPALSLTPPPNSLPYPLRPGRNYIALIYNFVEERV
jgi:hypothetical protein